MALTANQDPSCFNKQLSLPLTSDNLFALTSQIDYHRFMLLCTAAVLGILVSELAKSRIDESSDKHRVTLLVSLILAFLSSQFGFMTYAKLAVFGQNLHYVSSDGWYLAFGFFQTTFAFLTFPAATYYFVVRYLGGTRKISHVVAISVSTFVLCILPVVLYFVSAFAMGC